MTRPTRISPEILVRVLVACAAAGGAIYHLAGGEASLPLWTWKLAQRAGMDAITAVRLLAALEMTVALVLVLIPSLARPLTSATLACLALASVAELSARWGASGSVVTFVGPFAALVVSGTLLASRERWSRGASASTGLTPARARGVGAVGVLAAIALLVAALGIAARIPVPDRPRADAGAVTSSAILFPDPSRWLGKTLPDSKLAAHLPRLTPETLEGRHIIVFYSPRCGSCHEIFRTYFGAGSNPMVIAVEVPPPEGATLIESDQPEEIECAGCRRMKLPAGPAYFVHMPMVVVVNDGRITCVEWRDPIRCLPH